MLNALLQLIVVLSVTCATPVQGPEDNVRLNTFDRSSPAQEFLKANVGDGSISAFGFVEGAASFPAFIVTIATQNPLASKSAPPGVFRDVLVAIKPEGKTLHYAIVMAPKADLQRLNRRHVVWGDGALPAEDAFVDVVDHVSDAAWLTDSSLLFTWSTSPGRSGERESKRTYLLKFEDNSWALNSLDGVVADCRAFAAFDEVFDGEFNLAVDFEKNGRRFVVAKRHDGDVAATLTYPAEKIDPTIRWCNSDWYFPGELDYGQPSCSVHPGLIPRTIMTLLQGQYGWECRHFALQDTGLVEVSSLNKQFDEVADNKAFKNAQTVVAGAGDQRFLLGSAAELRLDGSVEAMTCFAIRTALDPTSPVILASRFELNNSNFGLHCDRLSSEGPFLPLRPSPDGVDRICILDIRNRRWVALNSEGIGAETTSIFHIDSDGCGYGVAIERFELLRWNALGVRDTLLQMVP